LESKRARLHHLEDFYCRKIEHFYYKRTDTEFYFEDIFMAGSEDLPIPGLPADTSKLAATDLFPVADGSGITKKLAAGTAGIVNTDASLTTMTIGGIPAGSSLLGDTPVDTINRAFKPYIHPTFTAFAITGQSTKEVGDIITGIQTFTWTISDPTHAAANSITISDEIIPQTLILGHSIVSPATFDFSTLPGGGVTLTSPGTYTWKVKSIDTGTPAVIFDKFFNLLWMWRVHSGMNVNATLTNAQILALANSSLATAFPPQVTFAGGGYFWYWLPTTFTQPTIFKDHATGFPIDMQATVTQSVTNANGIVQNYYGYRSTFILATGTTIDIS
jgi:hypothetical protein